MKPVELAGRRDGFALVLAVVVLALVVLAVGLASSLGELEARIAGMGVVQEQARLNARLGLAIALDRLEKLAGADERLTAMAGVAGVPAGASAATRNWCGVWDLSGSFLGWLASGADFQEEPRIAAGIDTILLVDSGSVGTAAANSEPVLVGLQPCQNGEAAGHYAFWVADEGTKISAWAGVEDRVVPSLLVLPPTNPPASNSIRSALVTQQARIPQLLSYEQLRFLPTPGSAALGAGILWDNFHHLSLRTRFVGPANSLLAGLGNINTTSEIVWRAWLEAYNASGAIPQLGSAQLPTVARTIATGMTNAITAGKAVARPFPSVADFAASELVVAALEGTGVKPEELLGTLGAAMTVRSDTFRIRAYGDSGRNAGRSADACAWCEVIVQRQPRGMSATNRRFAISYFRWLAPSDI